MIAVFIKETGFTADVWYSPCFHSVSVDLLSFDLGKVTPYRSEDPPFSPDSNTKNHQSSNRNFYLSHYIESISGSAE